ncbi:MAG: 6-carboxytetrahydropterin synthase [Bacteriovoracaceae bacterium]|nr:6-carboxytetrahydropterin synthase [Bacteriovoracaceae bacterium]
MTNFSIKVYKQYFNFASAHFLVFGDGSREPLHGHNYRVAVTGHAPELSQDMVFDFLDIKPIVRVLCDGLDHKILLPQNNPHLSFIHEGPNVVLSCADGARFSLPQSDVLFLPIPNTSAERLAFYLNEQLRARVLSQFQFTFKELEVEVEETPGQSASYLHIEQPQ